MKKVKYYYCFSKVCICLILRPTTIRWFLYYVFTQKSMNQKSRHLLFTNDCKTCSHLINKKWGTISHWSLLSLSHRTRVYRPTCLCVLSHTCWSPSSPSCCWRESPSSTHHRTCATFVMHYSKAKMRKRHDSTFCSRLLYVSRRAGLFKLTGGSTWWLALSELKELVMTFWCLICFVFLYLHSIIQLSIVLFNMPCANDLINSTNEYTCVYIQLILDIFRIEQYKNIFIFSWYLPWHQPHMNLIVHIVLTVCTLSGLCYYSNQHLL